MLLIKTMPIRCIETVNILVKYISVLLLLSYKTIRKNKTARHTCHASEALFWIYNYR